jgi:hypothetical protein
MKKVMRVEKVVIRVITITDQTGILHIWDLCSSEGFMYSIMIQNCILNDKNFFL